MKKLLVLNGSHSDVPLIQAAKRLGFRVVTTGNDPGLVGHRYADEYRHADYSDKDAVLQLAGELDIDCICSCANDFGAITAAFVAQELGLPGHDSYRTALTLHHKHLFKEFAFSIGLSTPRAVAYASADEASNGLAGLKFPLIVKPVDLTGGKGISVARSEPEFERSIHHAFACSRIGRIVVEEFVSGSYHSFSSFVVDRKIVFSFSDNEYSLNGSFHVSTSAGPASGIEEVQDQLLREAERVIDCLSLADGIFHIQYVQAQGRAWILEITRRCSGDFYPYPVRLSSGLDWAEWIVKAECGLDCGGFPRAVQRGFFGRHCVFARNAGVVGSLVVSPELAGNVIDRFRIFESGDSIDEHRASKMAAVVFLQYGSRDEMIRKSMRMNELVSVEVG